MSRIALSGDPSGTGTFTIASPNSNSNFTLTLPQANTTVVGTDATQTLTNKTIDASQLVAASVTSTQLATAVQPIGVGQTWQNVLGSRASGTTYTNSTGRPIFVCVNAAQWFSSVVVNGVSVAVTGSSNSVTASFVVPSGGTYSATVGAGSINVWAELR